MSDFTLGLEEEIFLCAPSGALVHDADGGLAAAIAERLGVHVSAESMRAQFELKTASCADLATLAADIADKRRRAHAVAHAHGARVLSAGLHPFARWHLVARHANTAIAERSNDYGLLYFRGLTGCFHLHIGLGDADLRARLAWLFAPFAPLLIAMTANSPLYEGEDTGLKSYRLGMLSGRPRSGNFPRFDRFADFMAFRETASAIMRAQSPFADPGVNYRFLGFVRPSHRHDTLEVRVFDGAPTLARVAPAFALAASLARAMCDDLDAYTSFRERFSEEWLEWNAWQAIRFGGEAMLMLPDGESSAQAWLAQCCGDLARHAQALGCAQELDAASALALASGDADAQLQSFRGQLARGVSGADAARAVTIGLMDAFETSLG